MDFALLIRHRLKDLGTEQRDLAAAAQVTESYISQLLTGKKAPPAPDRTDIYDKMESFLRLPAGDVGHARGPPAHRGAEAKVGGSAGAAVQRSARVDSAQMRTP